MNVFINPCSPFMLVTLDGVHLLFARRTACEILPPSDPVSFSLTVVRVKLPE